MGKLDSIYLFNKCILIDNLSGAELGLTAMGNKRQFPSLHEGYVLEWKQIIRKSARSLKSKMEPGMWKERARLKDQSPAWLHSPHWAQNTVLPPRAGLLISRSFHPRHNVTCLGFDTFRPFCLQAVHFKTTTTATINENKGHGGSMWDYPGAFTDWVPIRCH